MGRPPYRAVIRIFLIAEIRWPEIDAAYPGVDLLRLPVHRFLNYVYSWALQRIAKFASSNEEVEAWIESIYNEPLPGEVKPRRSPVVEDEQDSGFMSLMAETAGGA